MAARWSMQMTGWKELGARLRALPDAYTRTIVIDALKEAAEPMRARMAQLAPREPGAPDLADNIGISVANRLGDVGGGRWEARHDEEHAVAVGPTKDFFYGLFQEYGTVHHRAQPFMRPAFDSESGKALTILTQELWKPLRDKAASTGGRNL